MPTGYTAELVQNGQSFEDFVTGCMRAFGACVHMRDDSFDEKPKPPERSNYHTKALNDATKELKELKEIEDVEGWARPILDEKITSAENYLEERKVVLKRIIEMIDKVKKWTPPTSDHVNFKNFMLEQLETTLNYDGDVSYYENEIKNLKNTTPEQLYEARIDQVKWSVKYHTEEKEKEDNRIDGAGEWINAVYKSLGI
jgi:hypothetical protein